MGLAILTLITTDMCGRAGETAVDKATTAPQHYAAAPSPGLLASLGAMSTSSGGTNGAASKESLGVTVSKPSVSYGGLVGQTIEHPQAKGVLQLFNPFAPVEKPTQLPLGRSWYAVHAPWTNPFGFRHARTWEARGIDVFSINF